MCLLLDEMLDRRLGRLLGEEHKTVTIKQRGWDGKRNGELLALAQDEFDAFLTMDRGIEHQQNLSSVDLAVVLLRAKSNAIEDIAPLVGEIEAALSSARPGAVVWVSGARGRGRVCSFSRSARRWRGTRGR